MRPDFTSPIIVFAGAVSLWLVITLPFAFLCRHVSRQDALSPAEAFLLGLAGGPLGLYLVRKANERAMLAGRDTAKILNARRDGPEPVDAPPPPPHLMPGGNAFRPPPPGNDWLERDRGA